MNWKAYDEVNFSDQYILRWVREGDEYVNRISKEMMEDLHAVVRQQQAEIEALKRPNNVVGVPSDKLAEMQAEIKALRAKTLTDEEIIKTMVQFDVYSADDQCLIEAGRAILRKASEK